jgi:Mg2+-importing ATPase
VAVLGMGLLVIAVAIGIAALPVGGHLGFTPLPWSYWPILSATLLCYLLLTQGVKHWLQHRNWL